MTIKDFTWDSTGLSVLLSMEMCHRSCATALQGIPTKLWWKRGRSCAMELPVSKWGHLPAPAALCDHLDRAAGTYGVFLISMKNSSVGWCCGGLGFAHWSRNNLFPRKSLYDAQKQRERAARELCDQSSQSSSALQEKGGQLPDGAAPTFCSAITSTFCTLQLFHGILRLWHSWAELL